VIFQTTDGQDFASAQLLNNPSFDFICEFLKDNAGTTTSKIDPQKLLALVADPFNDKSFTTDYPICPNCHQKQTRVHTNTRTSQIEVGFATWAGFDNLTENDKTKRLKSLIRLHRLY
jgi:hypothetical protein